jgi:hypothetical protein
MRSGGATRGMWRILDEKDGTRLFSCSELRGGSPRQLLVVLKPNRSIHKRKDANCSSFHLRVFLGLWNPQGQRQTSILYIPRDNMRKQK